MSIVNDVNQALYSDNLRKIMEEYFSNNNINLDDPVYPPAIRTMIQAIPPLLNKIEVIPSASKIDPTTNYVKILWNLFVLGTDRMCLGHSTHESLASLERQVCNDYYDPGAERLATPRDIIDFIIGVFESKKEIATTIPVYSHPDLKSSGMPVNSIYYEKNKLNVGRLS